MNLQQYIPTAFNALSGIFPGLAAKLAIELFLTPGTAVRRPEELELLKSATEIQLASGCIAQSWGEGPIIFLCHGWGSRGTRFFNLIPRLIKQGFRVIAWDAPAHGFSPGRKTNLTEIAERLSDDLTASNIEPVGFVGHSMGGLILGVMHKYHRKLPDRVVIIASPSRVALVFERFFKMIKLHSKAQKIFTQTVEDETGRNYHDYSLISCNLGNEIQALVIHDVEDGEVPYSDFLALREIWKTSIFETTQDLGHRRILDDDTVLDKITSYLSQLRNNT